MEERTRHCTSRAKKGLIATTAVAAGLAGAALLYLRRRGVSPVEGGRVLGRHAKRAGRVLSQETRAAYREIRDAIVEEVAAQKRVTKALILATIRDVLGTFKRRGAVTKEELGELSAELKDDLQALEDDARERQRENA